MPWLRQVVLSLPLLAWAWSAGAVERIDIHVGRIQYDGAEVENLAATLDMDGHWQGKAHLNKVDLTMLSREVALPVTLSKGQLAGQLTFSGEGTVPQRLKAETEARDIAFSDAEGLHAGEKIAGRLALTAERAGDGWNWSGIVDWTGGEAFWQPWYLANGGIKFSGRGHLSDTAWGLEHGTLALAGVGECSFSGDMRRADHRWQSFEARTTGLDIGAAYPLLIKPLMEKTLLGHLEMAGRADVSISLRDGEFSAFDVRLRDLDVADRDGRFAFYKVNAQVPWALNGQTQASLHYDGGQVLNMPLGNTDLAGMLNGYSLTAPVLRLPVLDGELALSEVSAALLQGQWHWHLGASLTPVSMTDFSHAVGWPAMQGKMAASIPMVTYTNGTMRADGAMGFDVFDGSVAVRNLVLQNPLGLAPRLQADIQMRNLDLELLTRTYSFGAMTGRLDGDVRNMELSRWQPVKFDADFRSSPGKYPKKISQRAVENISALGGAGAAAAIQRSFLRFFKEFNYAKIGLSCKLRNGVCAMDGVEPAQSGYVIVKGSGIPAITVLGYNRSVSWGELLERIRRVTAGNASPVIK